MSDSDVEPTEFDFRFALGWWGLGFFGTFAAAAIAAVLTAIRNNQTTGEVEGILFLATVPFGLFIGLLLTTRYARQADKKNPSTAAILPRRWLTILGSISITLSIIVITFV